MRHLDNNPLNNHYTNLKWGTRFENVADSIRAGTHISVRRKAITECPQGHEYTSENTYTDKQGKRQCRECSRQRKREWSEKNREYTREYARQRRAAQKDSPPLEVELT